MTDESNITEGMASASTTDAIRHLLSFVVGILLSRLVKHGLLTGEEVADLIGFLPSLIFNVWFSYKKRRQTRRNVETALMMPEGSTVDELKAALSASAPTAVLSADENAVVVVKEIEKEEK